MDVSGDDTGLPRANAGNDEQGRQKGNVVTYLWWTIDSALIRLGRWSQPFVEQFRVRRDVQLWHDWDTELTEPEAERENWEPYELWASMAEARRRRG